MHILDFLGTLILFNTLASEDLYVDHGTDTIVGNTQRGILNLGGLLTENGTEQLLLRSKLSLSLGSNLTYQNIPAVDLGTDIDDTGLVKLGQSRLTDIRNIGGNFLRSKLGIAGNTGKLNYVNSGQSVLRGNTLGHHD